MRKLFILLLSVCLSNSVSAQLSLPTEPTDKCGFSIGFKGTIEMVPVDSVKYNLKYLKVDFCEEIIEFEKVDSLFKEKPATNTIDIFFGLVSFTDKDNKKENVVILKFFSACEDILSYKAEMKLRSKEELVPVESVIDIIPHLGIIEMWPHYIEYIQLFDFEKSKGERIQIIEE